MPRKRAAGEGTILLLKDGRWRGAATVGWDGVTQKKKYVYGKTQREAQLKLAQLRRDLGRGQKPRDERLTTGELLETWLRDVVPAKDPATQRAYRQITRNHLVPGLGRVRLAALDLPTVQAFLNAKARQYSPRTVSHYRAVLRAALNYAMRADLVYRNVAQLASVPKQIRKDVQPMTPATAAEIVNAVSGDRLATLYLIALALGIRQSEAFGLRWQDVTWTPGHETLRITQTVKHVDGQLVITARKVDAPRRQVALPSVVVELLRAWRIEQARERALQGDDWQDVGLLFTTPEGRPLHDRHVRRRLWILCREAGLPPLTFRQMRHGAATLLLALGVPLRVIQEQLGHTTISTTADIYTHVLPLLTRDAAGVMDTVLRQALEERAKTLVGATIGVNGLSAAGTSEDQTAKTAQNRQDSVPLEDISGCRRRESNPHGLTARCF